MKKVAYVVLGLAVLIVDGIVVIPRVIDWNGFKPEIADAVREATGRELVIDGEIEVSILPGLEFSVSGVRLSSAPEATEPDMLTLASVSGKIGLFPLIFRNVVIDRLIFEEPVVHLEIDDSGKPNWEFETKKPGGKKDWKDKEDKAAREARGEDGGGLPISGLTLGDVRVERGLVTYRDATTGQSIDAKDIAVTLGLADFASPFTAKGRLTLNEEPVTLDVSLDTPGGLFGGERALAKLALAAPRITAGYEGGLQRKPVPGLDGSFDLAIPSVGRLAAWLGRPLDQAQPDPGPLKLHAVFSGDGAKVALEEATIEGEQLQVKASGSFDGSGEIAKLALKVESGVLDIDRYLPPPAATKAPARRGAKKKHMPMRRGDHLAGIPDDPIDLTPLRRAEADVQIDIGGIKAAGFEVGHIAFATTLKGGVLTAELIELLLYGGKVQGKTTLDGSGEALGLDTAYTLDKVDLGALAKAATKGEVPVAGVASGSLSATAQGASPRALVQSLSGKLTFDLGGIDVKDAPAGAISELKANLDLPGLESPPNLKASVVYNKERVTLEASLDPLDKILAGEAFAARATVASNLVKASYDGRVLQEPVPGLDGTFHLDIPSVGKLAAWLGQPLDKNQPDPGPLQVNAVFAGEGAKVALKEATIKGKALDAKASGSFDGSGEVAKLVLNVESGVLDIDSYLPPREKKSKAGEQTAQKSKPRAKASGGDLLAALPDEPIDLSGLRKTEADIKIAIGGAKAAGFELGRIALTTRLKDSVLDVGLSEFRLYGGNVTGTATLDAAGEALGIETAIALDSVDVGKLARAATGDKPPVTGIASGNLNATAKGRSLRALAESLSAKLAAKLGGVDVGSEVAGTISALEAKLDLPGIDSRSNLKASVIYNEKKVDLDLTLDPLKKILGGETFAANLAVTSELLKVKYDGKVQQQPAPGLDGDFGLDVTSVGQLAVWLGQPLDETRPDPGPLKVQASLSADGKQMALNQVTITGKSLKATASGSLDTSRSVPYLNATLNLEEANLNDYLPPQGEGGIEDAPKEGTKKTGKTSGKVRPGRWRKKPIDFSAFKRANADVEVQLGKVRYRQLVAKKGLMTVKLAGGVLTADLQSFKLAKGTIVGAATVDASKPAAVITYHIKIDGVEARPLVRSFANSDRLSGTAFIETRGSARGASEFGLVSSLNGDGSFKFLDGAIHGFNLAKSLRSLGALGLGDSATEKTDFAEMGGTFTITKGVVDNRDFRMLAPLVRVRGAGVVPMPPRKVDYLVEAKLVGTTEGQGGKDKLKGLPIPVRITGPWHDISFKPDFQAALLGVATDPTNLKESLGGGLGGALEILTGGGGKTTEGATTETTKKKKKKKKKKKSLEEKAVDSLEKLLGD